MQRFSRQISLPQLGEAGQQRLRNAAVAVVGAGGLGCPILQYLAAVGVGKLGIIDYDVIGISNLNRQILYSAKDIGRPKVAVAASHLSAQYPDVVFKSFPQGLTIDNARSVLGDFDLVIDATDNLMSRLLINDACAELGKPWLFGAIQRFEAQIALLNVPGQPQVDLRDIFPGELQQYEVPSCEEAGVLGTMPGIVGTWQAQEAVKWLTGIGRNLANTLLVIDALQLQQYTIQLLPAEGNKPKNRFVFPQKTVHERP